MTDAQIVRFWRYLRAGMTVTEARHQAVVTDEARVRQHLAADLGVASGTKVFACGDCAEGGIADGVLK